MTASAPTSRERAAPPVRRSAPPLVWPLAALLVLTVVAEWFRVDLVVLSWFYTPVPDDFDPAAGWTLSQRWPWSVIDWFGPMPGVALGIVTTTLMLFGPMPRWSRGDRANSFVALCVLIAPLLLVNTIFKSTWGRPRPCTVAEFGGPEVHRSVWSPGPNPERNKSFPSGHASIGFVMMAPAFLFYRRRRHLYYRMLAGGALYGGLMSFARIVQGAHYPTDVMWSAGLVYLTAAILYRLLDPEFDAVIATPTAVEEAPEQTRRAA